MTSLSTDTTSTSLESGDVVCGALEWVGVVLGLSASPEATGLAEGLAAPLADAAAGLRITLVTLACGVPARTGIDQ